MLRRCLCIRFSPKCIFTSLLVILSLSILLALVFNINHDFGQSRTPVDFLLHYAKHKDASEVGMRWDQDRDEEDHMTLGRVMSNTSMAVTKQHNKDNVLVRTKQHKKNKYEADRSDDRHAQDIVSLLKKMQSPTTPKPISKKIFNEHVDLLHQAIMKDADTERPPMTSEPKCAGDVRVGEVEDLYCIPRPKFLDHVKNPCWYDEKFDARLPSLRPLRCLPYFHILGCAKSGTTDLWNRLMAHPHIISNDGLLHKEGLWWGWRRFGMYGYKKGVPQTFNEYVNLFQDTARLIQTSIANSNHYQKVLITGDASPPDFWDFRGWRNISQNRGLAFPQVLTPHLMKHMYPDPKFILMFKDPIDRLYSDYFFVGGGLTSEDFHRDIVQSVSLLAECVRKHDLQTCFFDNTLYLKMKVRLSYGCYSVFMKEWLRVFPLKHFLFLKTEDYEKSPEETLKGVIEFLGLNAFKDGKLQEIADEERSRITLQKKVAGPMKAKTKALLSRLLNPCSQQLAKMIDRPSFVWDSA